MHHVTIDLQYVRCESTYNRQKLHGLHQLQLVETIISISFQLTAHWCIKQSLHQCVYDTL